MLRQHQRCGDAAVPVATTTAKPAATQTQRVVGRKAKREDSIEELPERTLPPLQRFCERIATQPVYAAAAAYLLWCCWTELSADDVVAVVAAVCDAAAAHLAHGCDADALGWCLFAIEGAARAAWGTPRHARCATHAPGGVTLPCNMRLGLLQRRDLIRNKRLWIPDILTTACVRELFGCVLMRAGTRGTFGKAARSWCRLSAGTEPLRLRRGCLDFVEQCREPCPAEPPGGMLPAHQLALRIDWHAAAALCERTVAPEATAHVKVPQTVQCRALHLRRVLLEQHLDGLPLDGGPFWATVDSCAVRLPLFVPTKSMRSNQEHVCVCASAMPQ